MTNTYKSTPARMSIGGVFGIFFIALWPFVLYASELQEWPPFYLKLSFAFACLLAITISVILTKLKHIQSIGVYIFILFIFFTGLTRLFDVDIKHFIDNCIYITDNQESDATPVNTTQSTSVFHHPSGEYAIRIPQNWTKKDNLGAMFPYFQLNTDNHLAAELRPMCLDKNRISLGQLIINLRDQARRSHEKFTVRCINLEDRKQHCTAVYKNQDNKLIKISRFGFQKNLHKGYFLDFIIYKQTNHLMPQTESIEESIQPAKQNNDAASCLTPREWL